MINKEHKDRLFTYIFGREEHKDWILSLYNALNGSNYTDSDDIEINTIEDAVYMGMKNDASFLLHWTMNLWAHQASYNPNMPVRELMYLGKLYDKYIRQRKLNIYGSKLVQLPVPKIVIFYNGKDDKTEDTILKLSDAFPKELQGVTSDVEVTTRMLNINKDYNKKLMTACKPLSEYAWFIDKIRSLSEDHEIEEAVDIAINDMPDDYLLKSFLVGNKAEVKDMCITEYDEVETMQQFKEEGRQEGREEGRKEGRQEGEDKLAKLVNALISAGRSDEISKATADAASRATFYAEFNIS